MNKSKKLSGPQQWFLLGAGALVTWKSAAMLGVPLSASTLTGAKSAVVKLAGIGASLGTAYWMYQSMPDTQARRALRRIFDEAELYRMKANGSRIYPTVRSIQFTSDRVEIVFTSLFGIQPDKVHNASWLFQQVFGEHIAIEQQGQKFTVQAYTRQLTTFSYEYSDIAALLQKHSLPIIVGRDRNGWVVYDMVKHPHLLIAGETGSGKSTQLRSIITALIQSQSPDRLRFYMADLKKSEFHLFKGIEHVEKVVVEKAAVCAMLRNIQQEMDRRSDLLEQEGVMHVDDLSERQPYIVVCIDEVARLKKETDVMDTIEDISAIGRALGVFLILSMQRPDSEILDGKIKNNLTVRMAFRHSDAINSRITLGSGEAAEISLAKRGLMIFKHETMRRVQGPYLCPKRAKTILLPYRNKKEKPGIATPEPKPEKIFDILEDDDHEIA